MVEYVVSQKLDILGSYLNYTENAQRTSNNGSSNDQKLSAQVAKLDFSSIKSFVNILLTNVAIRYIKSPIEIGFGMVDSAAGDGSQIREPGTDRTSRFHTRHSSSALVGRTPRPIKLKVSKD